MKKETFISTFGPPKTKALDATRASYFFKWITSCESIPADHWQPPRKITRKKTKELKGTVVTITTFDPQPISEMHTMKLVNCIKWCVKLADKELTRSFGHFGESRATLLARSPQWVELLKEAKKRDLRMIYGWEHDENNWFRIAYSTAVLDKL